MKRIRKRIIIKTTPPFLRKKYPFLECYEMFAKEKGLKRLA
jgi:hypothetical protein